MRRTIILSLLLISVAGLLLGLGTFAYFSDTASSTDNTFSTGNINLQLSNDNSTWSDGTSATWTASGLNPGDTVDKTLYVQNTGSIPVLDLMSNIDLTADNGLASQMDLVEYNDNTSIGQGAFYVDYFMHKYDGDIPGTSPDGHLSLAEMAYGGDTTPAPLNTWLKGPSPDLGGTGYDTGWYCSGDAPGALNNTVPCLAANGGTGFFIHMKFQLRPDTGNGYQNASTTFAIKVNGVQAWAPGTPNWP